MRIARSVNSFGGFLTFAFKASWTAGTPFKRAMIDFRRSFFGGEVCAS